MNKLLFPIVALTVSSQAIAQEANCDALLDGGVFDTVNLAISERQVDNLTTWMCQNRNSDSSFNYDAQVTDIATGLGFGGSLGTRKEWAEKVCSFEDKSFLYEGADYSKLKSANAVLANRFLECTQSGLPGIWIASGPRRRSGEYSIKIGFNPVGAASPSASYSLQNAKGCESTNLSGKLFAGQRLTLVCTDQSQEAFSVVLNSKDVVVARSSTAISGLESAKVCESGGNVQKQRGVAVAIFPSACARKVEVNAYGSFTAGCAGANEAAEVLWQGEKIANWSSSYTSSTSYVMPAEFLILRGDSGKVVLSRTHSHCSNPSGEWGVEVVLTDN